MTARLQDLIGSNDGAVQTTTSDDDSGASGDELADVCEELGGNLDSAEAYVDENGNKSDLIAFGQRLADDEELREAMADYARLADLNRIRKFYLYDYENEHDASFSAWSSAFYGNSDDPEPGTYNYVQQRARDMDGNLPMYKAFFPEPDERYWDSDPVLWDERPDDDSHIYVEESWVNEFIDFTFEGPNGQTLVRPPTDEEIAALANGDAVDDDSSASDSGAAPFAPGTYTVEGLRDELGSSPGDDFTVEELEALLDAEKSGDDRKTAKKAIRGALNQARDAQSGQQSLDDATTNPQRGKEQQSDVEPAAAVTGRLMANELSGVDADPGVVKSMYENGMSEDAIVDAFR